MFNSRDARPISDVHQGPYAQHPRRSKKVSRVLGPSAFPPLAVLRERRGRLRRDAAVMGTAASSRITATQHHFFHLPVPLRSKGTTATALPDPARECVTAFDNDGITSSLAPGLSQVATKSDRTSAASSAYAGTWMAPDSAIHTSNARAAQCNIPLTISPVRRCKSRGRSRARTTHPLPPQCP